jgi:hypothetical protein
LKDTLTELSCDKNMPAPSKKVLVEIMVKPGRNDKNLYTKIAKGVAKNVDEPSREKLMGIVPSFRIGSVGTVAFSILMIREPTEWLAIETGTMVLKYLMNGILPGGIFDMDKSMDTGVVEFRAIEKG